MAIRVENLRKAYHVRAGDQVHDTLAGAMFSWLKAPVTNYRRLRSLNTARVSPDSPDLFWALRDVSLDVGVGEVLGVIGRNGAGKSTLLKVLSRIVSPTSGRVLINGRVGSLLEVGTGFHPELSGRENVYMNGAILGMTKREIDRNFDEIVEFSGIERFIDVPVKRYSSGMAVRLAFSVAAHLEPEVLIVDEVLAVGDAAFQKKCLGKMDDVSRRGRTVLFVSHNMASVKRLCTSVIRMTDGRIVDRGEPARVVTEYLREALATSARVELPEASHRVTSPLQIRSVEVLNRRGQPVESVLFGDEIAFRLGIEITEPIEGVRVGLGIYAEGNRLSTLHTPPLDVRAASCLQYVTCRIGAETLLPGFYDLHVGAHSVLTGRGLDWVPEAISFQIAPVASSSLDDLDEKELGLVRIPATWEVEIVTHESRLLGVGAPRAS